jgi:hypothetical protein
MKISQPERGGNGVRTAVVNQRFPSGFVEYPVNPSAFLREIAHKSDGFILPCPAFRQSVAANHHSARTFAPPTESF